MRVLFFIVHPSKFHLFRNCLELFKKEGIEYEFVIANKEVLARLLTAAGIPFTDIFPNGRKKLKWLPFYFNGAINLSKTLWRLFRFTRGKKFDVFITDDVLGFLGKALGVPTLVFTDNDLVTIPKVQSIFRVADRIIAPESTDLGPYNVKKIGFRGVKAVAHLHPNYFKRDGSVLKKYGLTGKKIFIIRLAKLNASHDLHGNPGITDKDLSDLIRLIPESYEIVISAERSIPAEYRKYIVPISESDFTQVMAHAIFFIGDSATMASEAAVLGVPNILINNIAKHCGVNRLLQDEFQLQAYFDSYPEARHTLVAMLGNDELSIEFEKRRERFLSHTDDFNKIMTEAVVALGRKHKFM